MTVLERMISRTVASRRSRSNAVPPDHCRLLTGLTWGALAVAAPALWALAPATALAQTSAPQATLSPAPTLSLPGHADSNSPVVWENRDGRETLHVLTSVDGAPSLAIGTGVGRLGAATPVAFTPHPGHGVWMEAVVPDVDGVWYGFYHNEVPAYACGRPDRVIPRIGAARSADFGVTWHDLGIVLEAPPGAEVCGTRNGYFAGGVGDFSVQLDPELKYLYIFFSQYSVGSERQGIAVARLPWASRDEPAGAAAVWSESAWLPAIAGAATEEAGTAVRWEYAAGTPLIAPSRPWHSVDGAVDAFWGPSVHWNPAIQHYVMLLNRTDDDAFTQEGVYVAYAKSLTDPSTWTAPQRLLKGGRWYPQVIGLERGTGSDRQAGARARFFMGGVSEHVITFRVAP